MKCLEKGLKENSQIFFLTPHITYSEDFYNMTVCGHFFATTKYKITRNGGVPPLFFFVLEGELTVMVEGEKFIAKKDQIVLLDCNKPHEYFTSKHCEFLFFHFDGGESVKIVNQLVQRNKSIVFDLEDFEKIQKLLIGLLSEFEKSNPVSDIEISCLVYKVLFFIQMQNQFSASKETENRKNVENAINYIRDNIYDEITLDDLAKEAALSKYHFSRIFKKETGFSPLEYVSNTKINLAKTILITTKRKIVDIALDLGFSSESSFINAFKSRTGFSPNGFRKK